MPLTLITVNLAMSHAIARRWVAVHRPVGQPWISGGSRFRYAPVAAVPRQRASRFGRARRQGGVGLAGPPRAILRREGEAEPAPGSGPRRIRILGGIWRA